MRVCKAGETKKSSEPGAINQGTCLGWLAVSSNNKLTTAPLTVHLGIHGEGRFDDRGVKVRGERKRGHGGRPEPDTNHGHGSDTGWSFGFDCVGWPGGRVAEERETADRFEAEVVR